MVLHPIDSNNLRQSQKTKLGISSAWEAVERRQNQVAEEWWLIAQPDHAALAGDLAALLNTPLIPRLDEPVLRAIALHDSGWARFDGGVRGTARELEISLRDPKVNENGKPLSFLEMSPADFVIAWEESIERAAEVSPASGVIVSEHFCRLTRNRLRSSHDSSQDREHLQNFLVREGKRQAELQDKSTGLREELGLLTDVLQFCDLLSLYLCCGADDPVDFPQKFGDTSITLRRNNGMYQISPELFPEGASLGVTARRYPSFGSVDVGTLAFLIQGTLD